MKALTWDKFRRLMGGKKKGADNGKSPEIDSAKFQRSYSFKRASVRKSAKRSQSQAHSQGQTQNSQATITDTRASASASTSITQARINHPIAQSQRHTQSHVPFQPEMDIPSRSRVRQRQRVPVDEAPLPPPPASAMTAASSASHHEKWTRLESPPPPEIDIEDDDERTNWILRKQSEQQQQALVQEQLTQQFGQIAIGRRARIQRLLSQEIELEGDHDQDHELVGCATRQSTGDSALSRTSMNSCSSSSGGAGVAGHSRIYQRSCSNVVVSSSPSHHMHVQHASKPNSNSASAVGAAARSRTRLSMSALNLLDESVEYTHGQDMAAASSSSLSGNRRTSRMNVSASTDSVNVNFEERKCVSALDSGCFLSNSNSNSGKSTTDIPGASAGLAIGVGGSRVNLAKYDDEDPPRSFWWTHQKAGSTLTTSSAASRDSGYSYGGRAPSRNGGWVWGNLANKMFGRGQKPKGPTLSVSKEGYFQRTNIRRSSSKGRKAKLPTRSSGRLRKTPSGRKRRTTPTPGQGPEGQGQEATGSLATSSPSLENCAQDDCTIDSSNNSIYQSYVPLMRRDQLHFSGSSTALFQQQFELVLPERRKSKSGSSEDAAACAAAASETHAHAVRPSRFEMAEIRLPRLKCPSPNPNPSLVNHNLNTDRYEHNYGYHANHSHSHNSNGNETENCDESWDCVRSVGCCEKKEMQGEDRDRDRDGSSSYLNASTAAVAAVVAAAASSNHIHLRNKSSSSNNKVRVIVTKSSLLRAKQSTTLSRRRRQARMALANANAANLYAINNHNQQQSQVAVASAADLFVLPRPSLSASVKMGDITQKGYEKKRSRILAPYLPKQSLAPKSNEGSASPSTRAKRRAHRRLTRNESRYHSEVRQEAVQQALAAMSSRPKPSLPMPSKRTSVMGKAAQDHAQHESGDSSTDDDESLGPEEAELDISDSGSPLERSSSRTGGAGGAGNGSGHRPPSNSNSNNDTQNIVVHSDSSSTGSNTNIQAAQTPSPASAAMSKPPRLPERNRVSNGTPAGPAVLTYSNLGNLSGGKLSWDERPTCVVPSTGLPAPSQPQPAAQQHHKEPRVKEEKESGGSRKSQPPLAQSQSIAEAPAPSQPQPQSQPQLFGASHAQQARNNRAAEMTDLAEAMQNIRTHASQSSQPPDVTSNAHSRRPPADRLNRLNQKRSQSSSLDDGSGTGRWKVSAKIQQLLNTLKRPKRRPLPEFYEDDDIELEMAAKNRDPNAPKPEGSIMSPAIGEQLVIPSGLPRNLEAAVQRYGSATFKAPVATVLDPNGKLTITLSYGKLLSRSHKIAFALLNKTGHKGEIVLKSGDRVALVFPNNDPINFICAFYGCLFAGIVPVPIEVPLTRRDAGSQQIGFLLGSCNVQVALTSEACLKGLPKTATGDVVAFKGWPKLSWFVTEHLGKTSKDFSPSPRVTDETSAYIEYTTDRDGSVMGVTINRATMLAHCRSLTTACNYTEGENMVCVLDFKREVGLWHSILTSVFNGMHVVFIPYALMKVNPASWMQMITKYRASVAIVKSRDLHWGLLATRDHRDISLASLRLLLVSDGANPWSLSSCDQFLSVFQNKGLRPDAICPCASSSEVLTVSLRRPGRAGVNATGRGVLSMQGLSHGVVRVDQENSLTSLTLQDCGQVMNAAVIVVVRMDGQPFICKTDEVGEICVHSSATGSHYWGLQGLTNNTFKVQPMQPDGSVMPDSEYVRSGLLGFLGPGGLVFVCGSRNGLMSVSGRKHNADDIIATVLAVEPMKFIYRGRIAVFSIKVLRDERICVIAEQRPDCSEEESFQWMSRVLQAVDSIHQVGIYCLVLVNPNCLPKTPLGGIHLSETKRKFLEGTLHPANVLMCPHTCVTNLPKPREIHSDIGPASVMVGNIVQGNRLATAHGRDLGVVDEESDSAKKYQFISEILKWRSTSTADHVIFTLLNSKGTATMTLTCSQLHKRAERVACLLLERAKINTGDHCALVYPPGLDLIAAFYGCLYAGAVPVTVRPPHPQNLQTTLPTVRMIAEVSKSVLILSTQNVIKLLKSKEASNVVDIKSWPLTLDTDDLPKKKLPNLYRAPTAEMIAYLDFSVSTTGMLAGIKMSHAAVTSLCRSMKLACELYPSRHVALCLDPYCGLGLVLWSLSSVYSGHHSILIPPSEVEANPALWLSAVSQYKVRDTFCSYGVMELCTKGLGSSVNLLKQRNVNLACVRTCVVVAEERPRINLTNSFSKLFSALGLSPRAVSTSFGCRVNVAICLQGASSPEPSTVYVDLRALRNDRVTLVERGSPHSLCVMESGKLLPGCKVIIANPETKGQCGDSHLGEIWVQSPHNASGYFTIFGDESSYADHFNARLVTGNTGEVYARTGYLGFLRRTENVQSDGELHDAVFVVGALDETIMLRGMRYHPIDIENSILRCHKKISECAVFTWTNLLVVVVELEGNESEALDVVPLVTNCVLEDHFLVVGVVVVVDPGVVPINSRGEKQRMHLRDGFLADQLDPIFVAYNM